MSDDRFRRPAATTNLSVALFILALIALTGCGERSSHSPAVRGVDSGSVPPVLLFNGTGSSPNDVKAVEAVLDAVGVDYSTADSSQLNNLTESQLRKFRLLIVPGGNFIDMGSSLNSATTAKVRSAVENGLNYLGICAGAFLAGKYYENDGLNLTSGKKFHFYSAEEKGIRKAPVAITLADGPMLEHYWEDGPELSGWGDVVGKYPDGAPAIVEGSLGGGTIILSGVHPEAPENWRRGMTFATPTSDCHAYAGKLILAALNQTKLPAFGSEFEQGN
jgi:glutamine amidotransferase-like uncharacterized protein